MGECSPDCSQPVIVGQIASVHGLLGSVRVKVLSDVPHRFDVGQSLFIREQSYTITSSAPTRNDQVILKFEGVDSLVSAQGLVGQSVAVPEASTPLLPEGEYYHYQLVGLKVLTEDGEYLGQIREILETGSNDVYVVTGESGELLLPALADVILKVQVTEGVMVVRLMEGLR